MQNNENFFLIFFFFYCHFFIFIFPGRVKIKMKIKNNSTNSHAHRVHRKKDTIKRRSGKKLVTRNAIHNTIVNV